MKNFLNVKMLLAMVMMLVASSAALVAQATHGEHGNAEWTRQSPIDIVTANAIAADVPEVEFHYPASLDAKVVNTGSPDHHAAIKAKVDGSGAYVTYAGEKYNLLQFHWHTLSEHTLNGKSLPFEVHFVHQKEGATDLNDLLVVGVWYEVGEGNAELTKLLAKLPKDESHYEKVSGVNINKLLPSSHTSYQYLGSLTTPPFTESVQWVVFKEKASVTSAQLDAYKSIFPHGNTREVQDLHQRKVHVGGK